MKSGERNNVSKVVFWVFVALTLVSGTSSATVLKVVDLQLDLLADEAFSQVFAASGTVFDKEFFISQDYTSDPDKVIGQLHVQENPTYLYEIRGGSVTLSPSELDYDGSVPDLFNSRAIAHFFAGATLTVTGSIWDVTPATPVEVSSYGTILEAVVDADFFVAEEQFFQNKLISQLAMDITGGDLATGAQGFMSLYSSLTNDITLYGGVQGNPANPPIVDFSQDMSYTSPTSLMQIYPVPEPATLCLLGLGGLALLRKRRA